MSQSCLRLAALRAEETERATANPHSTALVVDPFAAALAGFRKPADAHFVFRSQNQKRVREEAEASATHDASASAVSASSVAAQTASPSHSSSASAAALRSALLSRASALNEDRSLAPDTMIRTRFMDDFIIDACASDSPLPQLALLGAGLDSRAYRLGCLKDTAVYELDVAGVLQYKAAVFASLGAQPLARSLKLVPADFSVQGDVVRVSKTSMRQSKKQRRGAAAEHSSAKSSSPAVESGPQLPPWLLALQEAGFDFRLRTIWIAEGLLMYLGVNQVANILSSIAHLVNREASAPLASAPSAAGAASAGSSSSSVAQVSSSLPLHTLVSDVMNENMVRSKLKWFRFFRWGMARHVDPTSKGQPTQVSPIEAFMRTNGFEIAPRTPGQGDEGYVKHALNTGGTESAASSSTSDVTVPAAPAHLHIHPIGRDHLSYGRYLAPPLLDAESDPLKPPRLLETYLIVAHVRAI